MELFDSVIIGSGVAGMTAAIYLKRSNKKVLVLEKNAPGGQINRTAKIENYPGFQEIDGPTLAYQIYEQMMNLKVEYRYGNVLEIKDLGSTKKIRTDMEEIETKTVIIASGRVPRELNLEHEKTLLGHGISYCAICDGPLYKGKTVGVVGGGNSALEEALYLSDICKKVYIIHRRDELRAEEEIQEKVKSKSNVEFLYQAKVVKLMEEKSELSGVEIEQLGELKFLKLDGLFVYIGYVPDTQFLHSLGITLESDYVVVDENMKTSMDGIYACGDVIRKDFYQISTAVGEGAVAALTVKKELE